MSKGESSTANWGRFHLLPRKPLPGMSFSSCPQAPKQVAGTVSASLPRPLWLVCPGQTPLLPQLLPSKAGVWEVSGAEAWAVGTALFGRVIFLPVLSGTPGGASEEKAEKFLRLWGKSVGISLLHHLGWAAPLGIRSSEQRRGGDGEQAGVPEGLLDSPAAKSRTVQGISPPAFGRELWLGPEGPGLGANSSCEARAGKGEPGLTRTECFLSGRKLHTHWGTERDALLSPPLP